jgi:hypothetical protein
MVHTGIHLRHAPIPAQVRSHLLDHRDQERASRLAVGGGDGDKPRSNSSQGRDRLFERNAVRLGNHFRAGHDPIADDADQIGQTVPECRPAWRRSAALSEQFRPGGNRQRQQLTVPLKETSINPLIAVSSA